MSNLLAEEFFASDRVFYFGCIKDTGHYYWAGWGEDSTSCIRLSHKLAKEIPFGDFIDSGLLQLNGLRDRVDGRYVFELSVDGDWSALSFWDRSVDSRPGSNSAFVIHAAIEPTDLLIMAQEQWSFLWDRDGFPFRVFKPTLFRRRPDDERSFLSNQVPRTYKIPIRTRA